jgi:hypothetical protein
MRVRGIACVALCFFLSWNAIQSAEAPEADLKTVAVAAFKNGLAFFVRQGDVKLALGEGKIVPIPAATLGTLWLAPNDSGASLDELVAYRYMAPGQRNVDSVQEILLANPGKIVTIRDNRGKEYTGKVVKLTGVKQPQPPVPLDRIAGGVSVHPPSSVLLFETDGKLVAMPIHAIEFVSLPADLTLQVPLEEEKKALRFKVKGATERASLTMGYLQKGLGWTPSYLITLQDDKTAQITMQAVVTNDVEDVRDADVFFIVGVPNFAYADIPSPMALQQSLVELMRDAEMNAKQRNERYSNALTGQAMGGLANRMVSAEYDAAESGGPGATFTTSVQELVGAPEEDLFLYQRRGLTLARGERGTYNVFSGEVTVEHLYAWDIPDTSHVDSNGNVQYSPNSPSYADRSARDSVWHSLRLKNSTKFPWTSAPAMVITGTKPVAQDTLFYTPKGGSSYLKLTVATDIQASREEREVNREVNTPHRQGHRYDLVTVDGTLKVKNFKAKDVKLQIRKILRGITVSLSDDGKSEKIAAAIQLDNPMTRLSWDIVLKAGEERTITYRYQIWLRA